MSIHPSSFRAFLTDVFWFAGTLTVTAICADYAHQAKAAEAARRDTVRDLARLETIAGDLAAELQATTPLYDELVWLKDAWRDLSDERIAEFINGGAA